MDVLKNYLRELNIGDEKDVEVEMNVACGIIYRIDDDTQEKSILLIQRDKDDHFPLMYESARGKCDHGKNEKIEKCLIREVKEETGLDIIIERFIDSFVYIADQGKRKSIQYNFICRIKDQSQSIKLSKEHQEYQWVNNLAQVQLMVMPEMYKIIQKSGIFDNSDTDLQIIKTIEESFYERRIF